ncbi:MAG: dCTP pyrophosphatase [Bacilli bacterium]
MKDNLDIMLDMQHSLQVSLHNSKPDIIMHPDKLETCGQILQWMRMQDDFLADETRELYTSLGGDSLGREAASIWKPWKKNHVEFNERPFSELSVEDQKAVKMELIDQLHFFMCKFLALGMDSSEIMELYREKNKENFDRQDRGY